MFLLSRDEDQRKNLLSRSFNVKQECIPVGCVPAAHWPTVCWRLLPGGVSAPGGWCAWSGGGGGGVPGPGGVCLVLGRGGVPGPGGGVCSPEGGLASQHALRQTPSPLWTESQTPVKTLPWPNFVAAGKNLQHENHDRVKSSCTVTWECVGPVEFFFIFFVFAVFSFVISSLNLLGSLIEIVGFPGFLVF